MVDEIDEILHSVRQLNLPLGEKAPIEKREV